MLGRKSYTSEEVESAKTAINAQITAYEKLPEGAALDDFEPVFFNGMALALDRYFVHRVRAVAGKDANALNELELICEALMSNGGVLKASTVLKYAPETSATKLNIGDPIRLSKAQFENLAAEFFTEIERRFK